MAKRKTIAECVKEVLLEEDTDFIMWGDCYILDLCANRASHTNLSKKYPIERHTRILNALDKSSLFDKYLVPIHVGWDNRIEDVRMFKLKQGEKQ